MSEELKPCPYCGGPAKHALEAVHFTSRKSEFWHIYTCKWCGARTDVFEDDEMAAAAWNNRAERTWRSKRTCRNAVTTGIAGRFECSECGWIEADEPIYCGGCGAKVMSEEEQGHQVADAIRRLEKAVGR